jgi:two-component system, cell cycle sensor histidine kinase and response regulator CckA
VIHTESDYHREWQFRRKDGTVFPAEVQAIVMPDGNLLGMIRDITERKRAELRIRHLNRVYAVLSCINEAIVRIRDRQTMRESACRIAVAKGGFLMVWIGLTDCDTGKLAITAHAEATPDTLNTLKSLLSDGTETCQCSMTKHALHTGQHAVCDDIEHDPRAASWREAALCRGYRAMISLPLKGRGQVIGTFNLYADEPDVFNEEELRLLDDLAVDISFALEVIEREAERVLAGRALLRSEERFRELADNINEVFWMTDPITRQVLYISPAFEKVWGRPCASICEAPDTWMETIHPDDRKRVVDAVMTKQARGDYDESYRIFRPDGTQRWVHDRAFPVRNTAGEVVRIVGTAEEITERRLLEEQFRQSQKMEAIGQLAGGVAHDFNNILAAMMMQADLASMVENMPAESLEMLTDLRASAERAANLTRQLLAFGRRQVIRAREVDLNDIVTSLTKMLQRVLSEDVHLRLNLYPRPVVARADPGMLDQILLNLVINARDAMPGGGRLLIETTQRIVTAEDAKAIPDGTAGRHVCLRVSDTGRGITQDDLPHIFEPFFTTKELGKGTGLGLATVFGIVKQHGGWISVSSEVAQGTTFEILLPASEAVLAGQEEIANGSRPRGGNETILLVEDERAVRTLTRVVLERAGCRVIEAANGVEGLRMWEQHREIIELLLTDIVIPVGVSGRELAARVHEGNARIPVIFTSGYSADIAGRELSLEEGRNFIEKPSSPQQLLRAVRRSLDGRVRSEK